MDAEKSRVVYVSPYFDPAVPSGANRRFDEITKRFSRDLGEKFTLIVARGKAPLWWTPASGNLVEVDYRFNHWSKFRAARQIAAALNKLPPSTVIIESVPIPYRALKRHTHFQVAYDFRYFTSDSKNFFYRLLFSSYLKSQWRRAQYFVTCSDFSIAELRKYIGFDPSRVAKSYFGIDERLLLQELSTAEPKTIDVLYVGHFETRKNHAPLLRAIGYVNKHLKVCLVGVDNGLKQSLQNLAKELGLTDVTFQTINDDMTLWKLYRQSKVFAHPSLYEGFGIPIIEALALHVPVIASDIPIFHEVGDEFVSYFDPREPKDIARALREVLENPAPPDLHRVRMHLEKFLWENIYTKFARDIARLRSSHHQ